MTVSIALRFLSGLSNFFFSLCFLVDSTLYVRLTLECLFMSTRYHLCVSLTRLYSPTFLLTGSQRARLPFRVPWACRRADQLPRLCLCFCISFFDMWTHHRQAYGCSSLRFPTSASTVSSSPNVPARWLTSSSYSWGCIVCSCQLDTICASLWLYCTLLLAVC